MDLQAGIHQVVEISVACSGPGGGSYYLCGLLSCAVWGDLRRRSGIRLRTLHEASPAPTPAATATTTTTTTSCRCRHRQQPLPPQPPLPLPAYPTLPPSVATHLLASGVRCYHDTQPSLGGAFQTDAAHPSISGPGRNAVVGPNCDLGAAKHVVTRCHMRSAWYMGLLSTCMKDI